MPSIAVKVGWSPIGETAYTLMNKIQNLNALKPVETKRVFLNSDEIRFNSRYVDKVSFNLKTIFKSTGWTSDTLALSFLDEFPCLDSRVGMNYDHGVGKIKSWHDNLRVCPECFLHGIHLTFHQSPHWTKCPIHYINLQETCISCGDSLEAFEARYKLVGFSCKACGFNPFLKSDNWVSKKIEKAKINLATSYLKWVLETNEKINIAHNGKRNNEYIWVTPTTKFDDLSSYYKLFGGPLWMGKSLTKPNKVVRHKLTGKHKVISPRNTTNATLIDQIHGRNYFYPNKYNYNDDDFHFRLQHLRNDNTNEIIDIFNEAIKFVNKEIVKASPCITSTLDLYRHACIRNKYHEWREDLRSVSYGSGGISPFWIAWLAGPGRDFRISIPTKTEYKLGNLNKNHAYTLECTRIWMRTKFLLSAMQHFSSKYRHWDALNDDEPKYLLKDGTQVGELVLHEVSSDKSLKNILKNCTCKKG